MSRLATGRDTMVRNSRIVLWLLALLSVAIPVNAQDLPAFDESNTQTPALIRDIESMSMSIQPPNLSIAGKVFHVHFSQPDQSADTVARAADSADSTLKAHRGTVKLAHELDANTPPLVAGRNARISLSLAMEGLAEGEQVYAMVFAGARNGILLEMIPAELIKEPPDFHGMTIVAPGISLDGVYHTQIGGAARGPGYIRFDASSTQIFLESELHSGGASSFSFDRSSHPVRAMLPTNPIVQAGMALPQFMRMLAAQSPEEAKEKLAAFSDDRPNMLIAFNMVFLGTALGPARDSISASLTVGLPNLPFEYDSIALLPVTVRRDGPARAAILADTLRMPILHVPVAPTAGKSEFPISFTKKKSESTKPEPLPLPILSIDVRDTGRIPPGHEIKRSFRVRHGPAPAGAEIYVVLQPAVANTSRVIGIKDDRLVIYESTGTLELNACRTAIGANLMRIRQSPILVESGSFLFSGLEAGRLGRITSTEGGIVEGEITFTAPTISGSVYNSVRATPLLFAWDDKDGRLCARTMLEPDSGIDLLTRP